MKSTTDITSPCQNLKSFLMFHTLQKVRLESEDHPDQEDKATEAMEASEVGEEDLEDHDILQENMATLTKREIMLKMSQEDTEDEVEDEAKVEVEAEAEDLAATREKEEVIISRRLRVRQLGRPSKHIKKGKQ